jgi:hypothetical protein
MGVARISRRENRGARVTLVGGSRGEDWGARVALVGGSRGEDWGARVCPVSRLASHHYYLEGSVTHCPVDSRRRIISTKKKV